MPAMIRTFAATNVLKDQLRMLHLLSAIVKVTRSKALAVTAAL